MIHGVYLDWLVGAKMSTPSGPRVKTPIVIEQLRHGTKHLNFDVIVLRNDGPASRHIPGSPYMLFVADQSASIMMCAFPEHRPDLVNEGDILTIRDGYSTIFQGSLTLYLGKRGSMRRTDRFTKVFSEVPNMSAMKFDATAPEVGMAPQILLRQTKHAH